MLSLLLYRKMIRATLWNIRGIMNNPSIRRLKKLIKTHRLSCFAILEPKSSANNIKNYQRMFSCTGACSNDKGTIWVFWKEDITMHLIGHSDQSIRMELSHASISSIPLMNFVYASCDGREWRGLWQDLINLQCSIS